MSWVEELRQAFARLQAGDHPRVSFAGREDLVGEVGREFNALASELQQTPPDGWTREGGHRLRNRLAGILAVLQVQGEVGSLTAEERSQLNQLLGEAKSLDSRLRQPRS